MSAIHQKASPPSPLCPLFKLDSDWDESRFKDLKDLTQSILNQYSGDASGIPSYCEGRENELNEIESCLGTEKAPPNILITGQPGVGKTLLMSELARRILMKQTVPYLEGRRVFLLSPGDCKESKLELILKKTKGKAILVLDEGHQLFNSETFSPTNFIKKGSLLISGAEKLKGLLGGGGLPFIILTDRPEGLFNDLAWTRRFFRIDLNELDYFTSLKCIKTAALDSLIGKKCSKKITFGQQAIETAIMLSMAFLPNEVLPAKAYRILEPACLSESNKNIHSTTMTVTIGIIIQYAQIRFRKTKEEVDAALEIVEASLNAQIPPNEPLAKYTNNLTLLAKRNKLGRLWGREEELKNIAIIVGSHECNNVLLIGPAGVGKTKLIEGLTQAIFDNKFPALKGRDVLLLKLDSVMQGERLAEFLESAKKYLGKYILVIDEAHRLGNFNPTETTSSMSSSIQSFKEIWGRGQMPTILITTESEAGFLQNDPALVRRMVEFTLQPFDLPMSKQLMLEVKPSFEQTDLKVEDSATIAAVYLANVYLPLETQPASAVKLMNICCSYARSSQERTINEKTVVKTLSKIYKLNEDHVLASLEEEKAADHPITRRIPLWAPLRQCCDDLTRDALLGRFPKLKAKEEVLEKMIQTLSKPTCNNVMIIGPSGTGKTTIVKELARRIVADEVPSSLKGKPLLALRVSDILDPQKRTAFIQSVKKYSKNFILFIDEVHLLFHNPEIVEELKPLLSDGHLSLIGTTTKENFSFKSLDQALKDRFSLVPFSPPTKDEALTMLELTQEDLQISLTKSCDRQIQFSTNTFKRALEISDSNHWPRSAIRVLENGAILKASNVDINAMRTSIKIEPTDLKKEGPSFRIWEGMKDFFGNIALFIINNPRVFISTLTSFAITTLLILRICGIIPAIL